MTKPTLFDQFERTDGAPCRHQEDSFAFRNRVDQPYWDRVRAELEKWYAAYPDEPPYPLRTRFRKRKEAQHFGAWWELYLHHLFECLGFEVEVEPEVGTGKPDFRMIRDSKSFLLEATTSSSGIVDEDRRPEQEAAILDAINKVRNTDFYLSLSIERVGTQQPSVRSIVNPIEQWLEGLDPDAETAESERILVITPHGWELHFGATALSADGRGMADHRPLGIGPMTVGYVNDRQRLAGALQRKRSSYQPDEPLVIAVLTRSSGTMDLEDVESALLGPVVYPIDPEGRGLGERYRQRGGFWMRSDGPTSTRVSAVLTANNLVPETIARVWPRLWPNPWAARPLEHDLPFPVGAASQQGTFEYTEADGGPNVLLGLPADWPGPERQEFSKPCSTHPEPS